ncbi:MAG: hypothetical protein QOD06_2204 [Candidatus Binatota bacterium]|nr:hypothetical protein [Candidatus Binatota bacterium]
MRSAKTQAIRSRPAGTGRRAFATRGARLLQVSPPMDERDLAGVRVLDLADEPGFLAGRLLGDHGADVVKIEPPEGHPVRRRPPFWGGVSDPERGLAWLAQNTGKRGITLDLSRPRGRDLFLALVEHADVVLASGRPGDLAAIGVAGDVLRARNPRLIVCTITPFGTAGPRSDWRASDLTALAMGGNLRPTGDPDRPPIRCRLPAAYFHAGLEAAVGIVFALYARENTGRGQDVDVSLQEVMLMPNISLAAQYATTGFRGARAGAGYRVGDTFQREIWRCRDGWVTFALRGGAARIPGLIALVAWMAEQEMAPPCLSERDWRTYNHNLLSESEVDEMSDAFAAFFSTRTRAELYAAAVERKLMLAPVNDARSIGESEQLAAREFFVELGYPHSADLGGVLRHPGAIAKLSSSTLTPALRAPRLGEHNAAIYREIGLGAAEIARLAEEGVV